MTSKTRFALATLSSVVLALVCYFLVLAVSHRHSHTFDLTVNKRYSLAEQSRELVAGLTQPVKAWVFLAEADTERRRTTEQLMERYRRANPEKFRYEILDPDRNPETARKYEVRSPGQAVLEAGDHHERALGLEEEGITNALLKLLRQEEQKIYVLKGHGERTLAQELSQWKSSLTREGYQVEELDLMATPAVPEDATVVALVDPRVELQPMEEHALKRYLEGGGRLLVALDVTSPKGYSEFLKPYGFTLPRQVVLDEEARLYGAQPTLAVAAAYGNHAITRDFRLRTFFPEARPVETPKELQPKGSTLTVLASTLPRSVAVPLVEKKGGAVPDPDAAQPRAGPIPVAAAGSYPARAALPPGEKAKSGKGGAGGKTDETDEAAKEKKKEARLVVLGDADLLSNRAIGLEGNRDFALNAVNWLAESENLISIRPRSEGGTALVLSQAQLQQMMLVLGLAIPAGVGLTGFLVAWRRR